MIIINNKFYSVLNAINAQSNFRRYSVIINKFKGDVNSNVPQIQHWRILERNYADIGGTPGSGVGKGGGGGGTVRESGGGLGKYGAAKEEAYFYNKQKKQLKKLKKQTKGDDDKTLQKGPE